MRYAIPDGSKCLYCGVRFIWRHPVTVDFSQGGTKKAYANGSLVPCKMIGRYSGEVHENEFVWTEGLFQEFEDQGEARKALWKYYEEEHTLDKNPPSAYIRY